MVNQNVHADDKQAPGKGELPPISMAVIADVDAGTELLADTITQLLSNLNTKRVFIDLSTEAGAAIAADLEKNGIPYIIPDVEGNDQHVSLADSAAQVVDMPSPEELSRNEDHFIAVLGQQHLVPDEDASSRTGEPAFTPCLADPADSPASALIQKVAERMSAPEGKDVTLRLVMPRQLGGRVDSEGDLAYRIVQQVSVDTSTEYPDNAEPAAG